MQGDIERGNPVWKRNWQEAIRVINRKESDLVDFQLQNQVIIKVPSDAVEDLSIPENRGPLTVLLYKRWLFRINEEYHDGFGRCCTTHRVCTERSGDDPTGRDKVIIDILSTCLIPYFECGELDFANYLDEYNKLVEDLKAGIGKTEDVLFEMHKVKERAMKCITLDEQIWGNETCKKKRNCACSIM